MASIHPSPPLYSPFIYSIAIIFLFFVVLFEENWIWCMILIVQTKPVSFLHSYSVLQ